MTNLYNVQFLSELTIISLNGVWRTFVIPKEQTEPTEVLYNELIDNVEAP